MFVVRFVQVHIFAERSVKGFAFRNDFSILAPVNAFRIAVDDFIIADSQNIIRIFRQKSVKLFYRVRFGNIVRSDRIDVLSVCHCEKFVSGIINAVIFLRFHNDADKAFFAFRLQFPHFDESTVFRPVVNNQQFNVLIRLRHNRTDTFFNVFFMIVSGNYDGNQIIRRHSQSP